MYIWVAAGWVPVHGMGQHGVATLMRPGTGSPPLAPPPNGMGGSPPLPLWACGPGGLDFLRDPCEIQAKFVSGQDDSTHWVGGGGGGWPRGGRSTARQQSR